jgi:putative oxidoreductase
MTLDLALTIPRVVIGLILVAHGLQKLAGWFDGHGIAGTSGFLAQLGFKPARFWAWGLALSETIGGLLMALGLFSPVGPALVSAAMVTALLVVHRPNGFWNTNGGIEWPLTLIAVALSSAIAGPGAYSLDAALGIRPPTEVSVAVIGLVALGVLMALASRLGPDSARLAWRSHRPTPTRS